MTGARGARPGSLELLARLSARRRGVVLVYHAVGDPPQAAEEALVPRHGTESFRRHLEVLSGGYRVVRLMDLPEAVRARRRFHAYPVAITLDDDLPSHVEVAGPLLAAAGLPATVFLNSGPAEQATPFWWELLQDAWERDDPALRTLAGRLGIDAGRASGSRTRLLRALAARIEPLGTGGRARAERVLATPGWAGRRPWTRPDLMALGTMGLEIGEHTPRHFRLTSLSDDELHAELTAAPERFAPASRLPAIAYPHGGADARVAEAARRAGFGIGLTCRPQPVEPSSDPLLLGRLDVATLTPDGLREALAAALLGPERYRRLRVLRGVVRLMRGARARTGVMRRVRHPVSGAR